jgi:hypothetical protein
MLYVHQIFFWLFPYFIQYDMQISIEIAAAFSVAYINILLPFINLLLNSYDFK